MWALAGNPLVALSPQQIVDCDKGEDGCGGGDTVQAYGYVEQAGGLVPEKDYPYTAEVRLGLFGFDFGLYLVCVLAKLCDALVVFIVLPGRRDWEGGVILRGE